MSQRTFRTPSSYAAERVTRDLVAEFLESKGLTDVTDVRTLHGATQSQTVLAKLPDGRSISMRVRLCWRHDRGKRTDYSAAQLLAKVKAQDWEGSIGAKLDRERSRGITHLLLVQREDEEIESAALIPLEAVLPVWCAQRDISNALIRQGRTGGRTKNHAMNGSSPTIYLRDDRAREVADVLWSHPEVTDLALLVAPESQRTTQGAGGYGDPLSNRIVELAAIGLVRQRYSQEGWKVRSVEREGCGYDLECQRGDACRHIEVKGVRGSMQNFVLTAGELRRAEDDPLFFVAVVTSALTAEPSLVEYQGRSFLDHFETEPIQYRARLRASD